MSSKNKICRIKIKLNNKVVSEDDYSVGPDTQLKEMLLEQVFNGGNPPSEKLVTKFRDQNKTITSMKYGSITPSEGPFEFAIETSIS